MFNSLYKTSDCGQDLIFHCLRAGLQIWRIKWVATRALCLPKRRKDVGKEERGRERGKDGGTREGEKRREGEGEGEEEKRREEEREGGMEEGRGGGMVGKMEEGKGEKRKAKQKERCRELNELLV